MGDVITVSHRPFELGPLIWILPRHAMNVADEGSIAVRSMTIVLVVPMAQAEPIALRATGTEIRLNSLPRLARVEPAVTEGRRLATTAFGMAGHHRVSDPSGGCMTVHGYCKRWLCAQSGSTERCGAGSGVGITYGPEQVQQSALVNHLNSQLSGLGEFAPRLGPGNNIISLLRH